MADVSSAFIAGQQAGQQARLAREQFDEQKQENNLRRMVLKLQMDQMKVQEQINARKLDQERLQFLEGRPEADLPKMPAPTEGVIPGGSWEMPVAPVTLRGANGLPEDQIMPQSAEQLGQQAEAKSLADTMRQMAKARFEASLKPVSQGDAVMGNDGQYTVPNPKPEPVARPGSMEQQLLDAETSGDTQRAAAIRRVMNARDRVVAPAPDGPSERQIARFNQIAGAFERSPLTRAADRTVVLSDAAKTLRQDPKNAASQMALAYAYIQALDTYQSAVREGELQNLGALGTRLQNLAVEANKVATTGAFMPEGVAKQIADASDQLVKTIHDGRKKKMGEFRSRAKVSQVGDMWDEFVAGIDAPGGATAGVTVLSIVPVKQ